MGLDIAFRAALAAAAVALDRSLRKDTNIRPTGVDVRVETELCVSREVYSMTATSDALWTDLKAVGRMRDLPLRRQMVRPMWFDMVWTAL